MVQCNILYCFRSVRVPDISGVCGLDGPGETDKFIWIGHAMAGGWSYLGPSYCRYFHCPFSLQCTVKQLKCLTFYKEMKVIVQVTVLVILFIYFTSAFQLKVYVHHRNRFKFRLMN